MSNGLYHNTHHKKSIWKQIGLILECPCCNGLLCAQQCKSSAPTTTTTTTTTKRSYTSPREEEVAGEHCDAIPATGAGGYEQGAGRARTIFIKFCPCTAKA
ncbi:unnamed protein product [Arctogadus glacialis]